MAVINYKLNITKFQANNIDHLTTTAYTTDDWNQSEFLQQTSPHLLSHITNVNQMQTSTVVFLHIHSMNATLRLKRQPSHTAIITIQAL